VGPAPHRDDPPGRGQGSRGGADEQGLDPGDPAFGPGRGRQLTAGRSRGLDTAGVVIGALAEQLRRAGAVGVRSRALDLPIGEWGGRIGSFMASDLRAAYARLSDVFHTVLDIPLEDSLRLLRVAQQEWEQLHTSLHVVLAFGRKPG